MENQEVKEEKAEVSQNMIDAGYDILFEYDPDFDQIEDTVKAIYLALVKARSISA